MPSSGRKESKWERTCPDCLKSPCSCIQIPVGKVMRRRVVRRTEPSLPSPCTCGDNPNRSGAHLIGCPRFGTGLRDDNTVDPSHHESGFEGEPIPGMDLAASHAAMESIQHDEARILRAGLNRIMHSDSLTTPGELRRMASDTLIESNQIGETND